MAKTEPVKQKSGWTFLRWVFGIIIILSGISYTQSNAGYGIAILLAGAILLPPTDRFTGSFGWTLSPGKRATLMAAIIIIGATLPSNVHQQNLRTTPRILESNLSNTSQPPAQPTPLPVQKPIEKLVSANTASLLPADSEIDTIWRLEIEPSTLNASGFIEGTTKTATKVEDFSGTTVFMSVYRFDSYAAAAAHYETVTSKIKADRGYSEVDLGENCFGAAVGLSSYSAGSADGYCRLRNIYVHVESTSSGFGYQKELKAFTSKIMTKLKTS